MLKLADNLSLLKACADCDEIFAQRDGETFRQWIARKACDPCEVLRLRQRILDGTIVDAFGCWIWIGATRNGYGQTSIHDYPAYAHHVSYAAFVGTIPDTLQALHSCDVRRCCNPDHLFLGSQLDNVRDMWRKGRAVAPPIARGSRNHKATLTAEQVRELRALAASGIGQRELAARFGCSKSTAWRIANNITRASND